MCAWKPNEPPPDDASGSTMIGVPRVQPAPSRFGAFAMPPAEPAAPEAGGTMVGISRLGALPASAPAPESGGTMVGIPRFAQGSPVAAPEAGGTMIGLPRASAAAPAFGFAPPRPAGPPPAYDIVRHLGGGDLGQVFHARHRETGGEFALRIVRPDLAQQPGVVEALRDVVQLAQGATHTHLGRQLALDETASPTLVVEYVPGKPLSSLMRERGAAPAAAVVDLGVRLCSALAAAHVAGLAHGRVHAGNVVLEPKSGRWVLLDLGHAYALGGLEPAHDLYALAAVLYELATGRSPFEIEGQPVRDPRSHKPNLPASLSALLMRALAPDPALWFPGAPDFAQALARAKNQA